MIETARLILRNWREEDADAYAEFLIDPRVADWLGGPFTEGEALARMESNRASLAETGLGRMAVERKADRRLIGHCGLARTAGPPMPSGLEIGWALVPDAWGEGYASEAARAVIGEGFARHGVSEIFAFTGTRNLRSQAVMGRLGMRRAAELDFDHPLLADGHPLKRHLVFVLERP